MQFGGHKLVDTVVGTVARVSPAFFGLFYLSANYIKFTYLIKEIK